MSNRADLNVLFIEDSEMDVQLILRELRKSGYALTWERVETSAALREALQRHTWQLVIADSSIRQFGVVEALATTKELAPEVPFIVISGSLEQSSSGVAECISRGALSELGAAVDRVLRSDDIPDADEEPARDAFKHLLLATKELERRRIARGLHDTFAELLTMLRLTLEGAQRATGETLDRKLVEGLGLVEQALRQTRELSAELWPTVLEDMGLCPAIRWQAERIVDSAGLRIDLDLDDVPRLPLAVATACFRIVQEALTNTARHAGAHAASVQLRTHDLSMKLIVRDDGKGFDTTEAWQRAGNGDTLGITMMRERASLGGGQLDIDSVVGRGTIVSAWFPISSVS